MTAYISKKKQSMNGQRKIQSYKKAWANEVGGPLVSLLCGAQILQWASCGVFILEYLGIVQKIIINKEAWSITHLIKLLQITRIRLLQEYGANCRLQDSPCILLKVRWQGWFSFIKK